MNDYIREIMQNAGGASYLILFFMIFLESAVIILTFLPGTSLVILAGAIAGIGGMNLILVLVLTLLSTVLGNNFSYMCGAIIEERIYKIRWRFIRKLDLHRAEIFFRKHGYSALITSKFLPIVRTLSPMLAGVSKMKWNNFFVCDFAGSTLWTMVFVFLGFFFGGVLNII